MQIVLVHPQIPQNTGTIVRLCAVTGCSLVLVPPLGFSLEDRYLKRAGLDYWEGVSVTVSESWEALARESVYFFSSHASKNYTEVNYPKDCSLVFGSETKGLPQEWREKWSDRFLRIPMLPNRRCLNLANSASIVVYEAWRQQGFEIEQ